MKKEIVSQIFAKKYSGTCPHLCKETIISFLTEILTILFPQMGQHKFGKIGELEEALQLSEKKLLHILKCMEQELELKVFDYEMIVDQFFDELLMIEQKLSEDAHFIASEDPASQNINEVIICYPGFYAIAIYRVAHFFYQKQLPMLARILSEYAHEKTGIDIHPGAQIDSPFFIDHGTGIVIGETTIIGQYCKLFQGVTLGALSVKRKHKDKKRHPTIGNHCLIYSNATILGGNTTIGDYCTIGGNVWITESIAANAQVYGKHGLDIEIKKISD
jgi:serine O-acetyltransferase